MVNRIRELLEVRQLSPTQFADFIGVGRPVISHILSERNKPSLEVVQKVISAFPDISLTWLMSGSGSMLTGTTTANTPPAVLPGAGASVVPPDAALAPAPTEASASTSPIAPLPPPAPTPMPVPFVVASPTAATPSSAPIALSARVAQPPKFRPGTKPESVPTSNLPMASVAPPSAAAERPLAQATAATRPPAPVAAAAYSLPPAPQSAPAAQPAFPELAPSLVPTYAGGLESPNVMPTPAVMPVAATTQPAAPPASASNSAAAFSFLGDASKTVRRIVLFYSDGSFSDYRPEE